MNVRAPFLSQDIDICAQALDAPKSVCNATRGLRSDSFAGELDNSSYHRLHDFISTSGMKCLLRSPAHYKVYLEGQDDTACKPNLGTAAHCAVLEAASFDDRYTVFDGRRSGPKWQSFKDTHHGKEILSRSEYDQVIGIRHAVMTFEGFPLAKALEVSEKEKSVFWTDEETSVKCRIRPDALNPFAIFDLKTIDDCRPEKVIRQIQRMDYDLGAAMYIEGIKAFTGKSLPFIFVFVEDKRPHGAWLYTAGQSIIDSGMRKFRQGLEAFKHLNESDDWHGYLGAVTTLELPRYGQNSF